MKIKFFRHTLLCIIFFCAFSVHSKILSSNQLKTKSLDLKNKKEKVNNIMMRALTGVLAKNALKGVLSKDGKKKLEDKEKPERSLMQVSSKIPSKSHKVDNSNFWSKAEEAVHNNKKQ